MKLITVIDKVTGEVAWSEKTEDAQSAVRELKKNNFNPEFFSYVIKEVE